MYAHIGRGRRQNSKFKSGEARHPLVKSGGAYAHAAPPVPPPTWVVSTVRSASYSDRLLIPKRPRTAAWKEKAGLISCNAKCIRVKTRKMKSTCHSDVEE